MKGAEHLQKHQHIADQSRSRVQPKGAGLLADDEIAIWWMATQTADAADLHRWLEALDEEERQRAARFGFEIDRREFIAAHALLRSMLTHYLGRPSSTWAFSSGTNGKPRLIAEVGCPEVPFNLSHTRGLVAAAVSRRGDIGIDVEQIDPKKADRAVAEEYFAPAELRILKQAPAEDRTACFFRLWTLKEAYIKAIGSGLATPLNRFAFTFEPIRIEFGPGVNDRGTDWQFAILPTTTQHVLSIAVRRPGPGAARITSRTLAPRDLYLTSPCGAKIASGHD
jgi:4'-phosphopantetheinyl transferase